MSPCVDENTRYEKSSKCTDKYYFINYQYRNCKSKQKIPIFVVLNKYCCKMNELTQIHAKAYFNLLLTGSWVEEQIKKALKPFDLTHAQLNVLYVLHENHPNPVSAGDIKPRILVSNPDVTRLLDRLVKKEIINRVTCPDNRRKIDVTLTPKGRALFIEAHESARLAVNNFFQEKITAEEASELRRILHKIRD
jgi:DNA-binding MarR family transcriptional regulator